jgi:hypothetical protein
MPRFDEGVEITKLEYADILLTGNPGEYSKILAQNILVEDITRASLQTLITNSRLVRGKLYRITNAVGSTLSIIVQALTANTLGDISYNSATGDIYTYSISTDTGSVGLNLGENGLNTGFVTYDTTPTNTPTSQATTYWDSTEETLALIMNGVTQRVGLDSFFNAKNSTGTSIPKGTAVRFAGTDGNSGNLLIAPMLADGTYPSVYYMGITSEAIGNGQFGKVMSLGKLRTNTNAYVDGDILYVSSTVAGGFQTTAPLAPNNIIIAASVVNAANNGVLEVRATLGSNINNDEGVKITTPLTGQLLQLQSNGLWENKTKAQILGGTSTQFVKGDGTLDSTSYTPTSRQLTINGTTYDLSANRTWTIPTHDAVTLGTANGLSLAGQVLSLGLSSSSANGALSSTDWSTFNAKQAALNGTGFVKISGTTISYDNSTYLTGNQTITLSGEASGSGATSISVTLDNAAVINKVLTGLNVSGSAIVSTDSILVALGKVQNQINALAGGVSYQGTWNASTNTPALTSSVGTKGYYYVVSVAGSTNLNGITDWKLGDWVIFNGSTWDKVDNTDAVISVNGYTGIVTLAKGDIGLGNVENTALSTWAGSTSITTLGTIGTGVWQGTAIGDTYISSATTWNAKIGGSGTSGKLAKFTASGAVGDSIIEESSNAIGIDTTSTSVAKINVRGTDGEYIAYLFNNSGTAGQTNGLALEAGTNINDITANFASSAGVSYLKILGNNQIITNNATNTGEHFIVGGSARVNGTLLTTGAITVNTSTAGLILNRPSTSTYTGTALLTNGAGQWFVGMRENLTSNNYVFYNEITASDVLTLSISTGAATFSSSVTVNGVLGVTGAFGTGTGVLVSGTTYGLIGVSKGINNASAGINYYEGTTQNVGMRENLTSNNYVFYNEITASDVLTLSISTGAATFSSSVTVGNSTNGRLGVRGTTNDSSAFAFEAANSSGATLFIVRNDGQIYMPTGNVGIGTTTPGSLLDVNGEVRINNTVAAAVAVASTHKVTMVIGGVTYYLLATT